MPPRKNKGYSFTPDVDRSSDLSSLDDPPIENQQSDNNIPGLPAKPLEGKSDAINNHPNPSHTEAKETTGNSNPTSISPRDMFYLVSSFQKDCANTGYIPPFELRNLFKCLAEDKSIVPPPNLPDIPVSQLGINANKLPKTNFGNVGKPTSYDQNELTSSDVRYQTPFQKSTNCTVSPALQSVHDYAPAQRNISVGLHNDYFNTSDTTSPGENYITEIDEIDINSSERFNELRKADVKPHPIKHQYDGGDNVDSFEHMCLDVMLFFQTSKIRSNAMRIKYMAQAFAGRALQEYAALIGQAPPPSPSEILRHIRNLLPDNISHSARRELQHIKQGSSTIAVFDDRVRRVARRMRYCSLFDLAHYFFDGLNVEIAARISGRGIDPDYDHYDIIVIEASRAERELHIYNSRMRIGSQRNIARTALKPSNSGNISRNNSYDNSNYSRARPAPTSKPLKTNTPVKPLQCFNCRQPGHTYKDCPKPKTEFKKLGLNQIKALREDLESSLIEQSDDEASEDVSVDVGDHHTDHQTEVTEDTSSYQTAVNDDNFVNSMKVEALDLSSEEESDDFPLDVGLSSIRVEYTGAKAPKARAPKPRIEFESPARPAAVKNCLPFSLGKTTWDKYRYVRIPATVNDHPVICMIDTGSNANLISASVASLYNLPTKKLDEQLVIKLACQGTRSKCNEYAELPIVIEGRQYPIRMLVLNISENIILGTPFLHDYEVAVRLNPPGIQIDKLGRSIDTTRIQVQHIQSVESFPSALRESKRKTWINKFKPLTSGIPDSLPKFREVNHEIKLIDENKTIPHRRPRCSEAMYPLLQQKIDDYVKRGLWRKVAVESAPPLLAIPKPKIDGLKLRAVVDKRAVNDNTIKDLTPFPDQSIIRRDFARAKFRSKLDMTDAYEQVRVVPNHVNRTAFSTPTGCFVSEVIQQGDCNAPATFQRLMTTIFSEGIGSWIHVYLDDIFVFNQTLEEHEKCLQRVFDILYEQELYLSKDKVYFFTEDCECLGFKVDDQGIHPDPLKIRAILNWPEPTDAKDIMRFLGLVNYIINQVPLLSIRSAALSTLTHLDEKWRWGPVEIESFKAVKAAVERHLVLKPIDWIAAKDNSRMKVFVVCDACPSGVGAVMGQGPTWDKIVIADMWSARFSSTQSNYPTHQQELLAIVGALDKFEDQLMGRQFMVVTDHRSLEYFKRQPSLSPRQVRWYEFLSRFHFNIVYVKGHLNLVADALSRKYENKPRTDNDEYVDVDIKLEDTEDVDDAEVVNPLISNHIEATHDETDVERSNILINKIKTPQLKARVEDRSIEADQLANNQLPEELIFNPDDVSVADPGEQSEVQKLILQGYNEDKFFHKVVENEVSSRQFFTRKGDLIFHSPSGGNSVLAIPLVFLRGRSLRELIIDHFHVTGGHLGYNKTLDAVRRNFWWPSMVKEIDTFCKTCHVCAMTKVPPKAPDGLAHPLAIPRMPWEVVAMDFLGPFPPSNGNNYLWVIVCKLTNMVHLIPLTTSISAKVLAELYFQRIFPLHGLPNGIVSDRDSKFVSKFWSSLHKLLGTKLLMSSAYHPQTDGATERVNRTIGTILRGVVTSSQNDWYYKLPYVEFAINSSTSKSTGYSPFELNYGYVPASLRIVQSNVPFEGVRLFAEQAHQNLMQAHDSIIAARMDSAANVNRQRNPTPATYKPGTLVYFSTKNLQLPQGLARKLVPKYIGPFKIIKEYPNTSTFKLDFPSSMRIHPNIHASLLRPHIPNDDNLFPKRDSVWSYTLDLSKDQEYEVDSIIGHYYTQGKRKTLYFVVSWSTGEVTPEPLDLVNELEALDHYLELQGVTNPLDLE